ncbi:transcriptional regulator [Gabonibacter chumensis]|uniref:transcriptional regulator n=1 Tax=Gabonibacter chumensis TaxID=2972474 RepID=UPI00257263ED|nr:transcriptional regulator [Gabonibacter chumensis]MCR9010753.1 transcriptional regulator [Gabonibacter chumensis]
MKKGDKVLVSPNVTGLSEWIEGVIIDIEMNPIRGVVITVETKEGQFFDVQEFFKPCA